MRHPTRWLVLLAVLCPRPVAAEVALPEPQGYVNDLAGVLTPDERGRLQDLASSLQKSVGAELAIAIVPTVEPLESKSYAVQLFAKWGVGKKGKDNGVLILLAMKERRVEIEVGYGLEGILPDAVAGRLLDRFAVPEFREGRMGPGTVALAAAVAAVVASGVPPPEELPPAPLPGDPAADEWTVEQVLVVAVAAGFPVILMLSMFLQRPWMLLTGLGGLVGGTWLFGWIGALVLGLLGAIAGWFTPKRDWAGGRGGGGGGSRSGSYGSRSSSGSSSSGSSGSSGSSSGGSFGGGSSGGGGAGRGF
jgi:uncharacterized protein